MTAGAAWGHRISWANDPDQLCFQNAFGAPHTRCGQQATYQASCDFRTPTGRITARRVFMCAVHAAMFARQNGIESHVQVAA